MTDYVSRKHWSVTGSLGFDDLGIISCSFESGSPNYASLDQSFYRGVLADGSVTGSYDLDLQTTLTVAGCRTMSSSILIYSIPRVCFDTKVEENSVTMVSDSGVEYYDREGLLLVSGSNEIVGDIVYTKGLLLFNRQIKLLTLHWTSNKPIYTYNMNCKVRDVDMNYTLNPTAKGLIESNAEFYPYVTSLGFYNSANELMAIAKLSKPIRKASDVDTTFKVSLDII